MFTQSLIRGIGLTSLFLSVLVDGATLTVSTTGGNASSPLLYGLMFEVISSFLVPSSLTLPRTSTIQVTVVYTANSSKTTGSRAPAQRSLPTPL